MLETDRVTQDDVRQIVREEIQRAFKTRAAWSTGSSETTRSRRG